MEIILLLLDELDDATATLRMWVPQMLGFLIACGLLAASVSLLMHWPWVAAGILLLTLSVCFTPGLRIKPVPAPEN